MRTASLTTFLATVAAVAASGSATAAPGSLSVALEQGAQLGRQSPIRAELRIDPKQQPSPLTSLRLLYPDSLGVTTSGLGLAECRRSPADFRAVSIESIGLAGCSPNAVMAIGDAQAAVRLGTYRFRATASITVLSGAYGDAGLGLVVFVDGVNPLGYKLAYSGSAAEAPAPFGGQLAVTLPPIPALPDDATYALTRLRLTIGDRRILYDDHGRRYRPGGIELPARCPRGGFRFRAELGFQDGSRARQDAWARCPR